MAPINQSTYIPIINIGIETRTASEHVGHVAHIAQIWNPRGRGKRHVRTAVERALHGDPSLITPLLDRGEFILITAVIKIDTRESTRNTYRIGAWASISMGSIAGQVKI